MFFQGELALAFGDLLRMLWIPGATPVAPRMFKMKLANFAPQFSGYMQHDSQVNTFNFLAFFFLISQNIYYNNCYFLVHLLSMLSLTNFPLL